MSNSAMHEARQRAAMQKQYSTAWGVMSFGQALALGKFDSALRITGPAVKYSRRKWNRLDAAGQARYAARMEQRKTSYAFRWAEDHDRVTMVPKLVFDAAAAAGALPVEEVEE